MHAMWMLVTETIKCGSKLSTDVLPKQHGFVVKQNWKLDIHLGILSRRFFEHQQQIHQSNFEVLRVNNTIDTLEKFEKYRETVKKRSFGQYKNHQPSKKHS
ncbi:hypothetical protein RDI58_029378 [Solanum bulbocastanum]|uniref:Uncharacterized protein n=1 Tax=Solanum bulbocastanum TaxID=147425 RepID=A0AAN8SUB3_SOLBU